MKTRNVKVRAIKVVDGIIHVPLTKGYTALVSIEDRDIVEGFNWFADVRSNTVYALRWKREGDKGSNVAMHREIMKPQGDEHVDHINHNGLDNRRNNLRICNQNENHWNCRKHKNNKSGYKGVYWYGPRKKWCARIQAYGENRYLGLFDCPKKAHEAYCEASKKYHKDFGYTGSAGIPDTNED